jgi:uncharacterized protein (TIGR00255 family)
MIRSMTGYGKAAGEINGSPATVEIKSLNSKFLELSVRLPAFRDKEPDLRMWLAKEIERGKADVSLVIEQTADERKPAINKELVVQYYNDLKSLKNEAGIDSPDYLRIIMGMPNVLNAEKGETDEKSWKQIEALFKKALKAFNEFRTAEGKTLAADYTGRLGSIAANLVKIEQFEPARISQLRARLKRGLDGLEDIAIDKNRFEQEMIYYIEKFDITEEKVRLQSHIKYFSETLKSSDSNGKKLGFILQEIGREINTIGSKANDADIQKLVVEMKDELEKMKEQSANVL